MDVVTIQSVIIERGFNMIVEVGTGKEKVIDKIYHYTSVDGLQAIISNKTLRFTECSFLNDRNEYKGLGDLIDELSPDLEEEIKELLNELKWIFNDSYEESRGTYCLLKDGKLQYTKSRFYILSLSIKQDSLPMWNYYSKNSNNWGYNLEISKQQIIEKFFNVENIHLDLYCGKIIYSDQGKKDFIKFRINEIYNLYLRKVKEFINNNLEDELTMLKDEMINEIYDFSTICRLFFKDDYFRYEEEYRFILRADNFVDDDSLKKTFSNLNGVIRPHVDLKFENVNFIKSITISPLVDYDLAQKGLNIFLEHNRSDLKKIKIKKSKINIRF